MHARISLPNVMLCTVGRKGYVIFFPFLPEENSKKTKGKKKQMFLGGLRQIMSLLTWPSIKLVSHICEESVDRVGRNIFLTDKEFK